MAGKVIVCKYVSSVMFSFTEREQFVDLKVHVSLAVGVRGPGPLLQVVLTIEVSYISAYAAHSK